MNSRVRRRLAGACFAALSLAAWGAAQAQGTQAIYYREEPDGTLVLTDDPGDRRFERHGGALSTRATASSRGARSSWPGHPAAIAARPYHDSIVGAARTHSLDAALLHAIVTVESGYRPTAVSHKGARGLMQLMPATAARYGVAETLLHEPAANLDAGARHLAYLLQLFEGNLTLAIAAYNAGENAVLKYGATIPPYPETQDYVPKVLKVYQSLLPAR